MMVKTERGEDADGPNKKGKVKSGAGASASALASGTGVYGMIDDPRTAAMDLQGQLKVG